jgi:hypothetical protein
MEKNCQSFETKKLGPKKQQQKTLLVTNVFLNKICQNFPQKIEDVEFSNVNSTNFSIFLEIFSKFLLSKN